MTVQGPPPTTIGGYDIQAAATDVVERVGGLEAIPNTLMGVGRAVGMTAGAAAGTSGGIVAVDTAETAGIAATEAVGWVVILVVLAVLLVMRVLEHWLEWLAGNIPFFGSKMRHAVTSGFYWIDKVENACIALMEESAKHLLHTMRMLVFYSLGVDPQALANLLGQTHQSGGVVTQAQINHLQAEINYLRQHLGDLQYMTQPRDIIMPVPQNIWDQLHHLEAQTQLLRMDMTHVLRLAEEALHTANSTQAQQAALQKEIHEVRAVAVGWQDIATQLDTLGTQVTQYINTSTAEISAHSRQLVHLQPLHMLLQPGIAGLKNLRKLEDNPCQCPKLPGIPSLMPDRLAIYEFLTNG